MTERSSDDRLVQPPDGQGHRLSKKDTAVERIGSGVTVLRANGRLTIGEMSHEEAESYLALRKLAEAGNADARLVLTLLRTQEQVRHSPPLCAQLQKTIDMLLMRLRRPG